MELVTKLAELQFMNRDHVLLFRGQTGDHLDANNGTSLKPSLFRSPFGPPPPDQLITRFNHLKDAERLLIAAYRAAGLAGLDRLTRHRILRWAILQHYEVCPTPLLDVTHSLRIAASFASHGGHDKAFIFVVAVPNLSGSITASAEAGLQIVRLASVCPPSALRPHLQEGYLLAEYPDMADFEQKALFAHYEIDFGRRLVGKFCFDPQTFWRDDAFPIIGTGALYPSAADDPLRRMSDEIKANLPPLDA